MLVLCDDPEQLPPSASARSIARSMEIARMLGYDVHTMPPDFERCETGEGALWHIPARTEPTAAVWVGFLPALDRYTAVYEAALAKGIHLINDPQQHRVAMEMDLAYPFLVGLTPESVVLRSPAECAAAGQQLGYPVFVKGAVQSRKRQGWSLCVAEDLQSFEELVAALLPLEEGSRGRVIARRYAHLRHARRTGLGIPVGREYRFFLCRGRILEYGYYWDDEDDFGPLTDDERSTAEALAAHAAARLRVPYVALDLGQEEDGRWIVIEANDAQFSGLGRVPALNLWSKLAGGV